MTGQPQRRPARMITDEGLIARPESAPAAEMRERLPLSAYATGGPTSPTVRGVLKRTFDPETSARSVIVKTPDRHALRVAIQMHCYQRGSQS